MLRLTDIRLPLDHPDEALPAALGERLGISPEALLKVEIWKRSYDARRKKAIYLIYIVDVEVNDEAEVLQRLGADAKVMPRPDTTYRLPVTARPSSEGSSPILRPVVVGTGPCGLFAGLALAQMGFRPLILERGKAVRERTVDTFGLWRKNILNPESNVQFGEGGAGTFSDGKLYSQVKDPGYRGRRVLNELVAAGAPGEILWLNKPHIGTFKLVRIVEHLRATIQGLGGEIRFGARLDDLDIEDGRVRGIRLADGEEIRCDHLVLAVGHSARDTFQMLHRRGAHIEAKPFSVGFRIEHPQSMVDRARFGPHAGHPILGPADYKLVHHGSQGRSVYSFCMCPGGTVVAAASEPGRVVTNGMSQYSRDERNANAGIVVGITPEDYPGSPLAGIELQRRWESQAFVVGGGDYRAPGQLVGDFIAGRPSKDFGSVLPSYRPGVLLGDLSSTLPGYAIEAIREALPAFDHKLKGFAMHDAVLTGVETRTSSPIRIRRDETLQNLTLRGLYPAGEGAGYAGGILSAAIDGLKVAEAVASSLTAGPGGASGRVVCR